MGSSRVIAAGQTCPVPGDVQTNVAEHVRLTRLASAADAGIIVFPELSLTGYEIGMARALAFSEDDARLCPLLEVAAANAITLIAGAPVRIDQRLHIGAFIISPDGDVMLYTKHHLGAFQDSAACDGQVPPAEATVFEPGDSNPLVQFGDKLAAVAVCADTGRSAHPQRAADNGATAYLASMFVIPSDFARETARLAGYAVTHSMVVAMANFGGPSGGLRSAGRSTVWSEKGECLIQLNASGAGVAIVSETEQGWCPTIIDA